MSSSPAEILSSAEDVEDFRRRILRLEGAFPFDEREMMDLGRVYFLRYPDSSVERNMENIRAGYRIVRICILEKILEGIEPNIRPQARELFGDTADLGSKLESMRALLGAEGFARFRRIVGENLERIREVIDRLPRGMIKERFVGGVSKFYNVLYLIDREIEKQGSR